MLRDVFGQEVEVGDKIAAGMAYMRSSVLRVGEIIKINAKPVSYGEGMRYSIRVRWTHNGNQGRPSYFDVKESTILFEDRFTYAKFVKLPAGYVEQFPSDNGD